MRHRTCDAVRSKFYQTGTFTVGNRLLAEDQRSVQARHASHQLAQLAGIAPARAAAKRSARATRSTRRCARRSNQLIAVNATGCLEVFSTPYPETSWQIAVDPFAVRQRGRGGDRRRRGACG